MDKEKVHRLDVGTLFDDLAWYICLENAVALDRMYDLAVSYVGHDVPAWKVTDPRWDGIGQLIYACNMVWRKNNDGWRIVAETARALMEHG